MNIQFTWRQKYPKHPNPPGTEARIEFNSVRPDRNPLSSDSQKPRAAALCVKWGTVTNTAISGLTPQGELEVE
jgi:hypothetical protein